ncbi:MAG: hypothetical protein DRJ69_03735 [Thermoprotei archaeon]|nr:MAG: hypothetical protein DRJ69_03735 [Thermoprotei archaeon]
MKLLASTRNVLAHAYRKPSMEDAARIRSEYSREPGWWSGSYSRS